MSRRDEVLTAAIELLDEVGLDDLTTRRLAERLGIRAGALYRHFENKRALLDAMADRIAAEGGGHPQPEGDWADQVRVMAIGARSSMLAHRDGALLMATFYLPGAAAVAAWKGFIVVFREAGASARLAALSVDTIVCYVNGFTIEEQARKTTPPTAVSRRIRDRDFRAGLEVVIAGIDATLRRPELKAKRSARSRDKPYS